MDNTCLLQSARNVMFFLSRNEGTSPLYQQFIVDDLFRQIFTVFRKDSSLVQVREELEKAKDKIKQNEKLIYDDVQILLARACGPYSTPLCQSMARAMISHLRDDVLLAFTEELVKRNYDNSQDKANNIRLAANPSSSQIAVKDFYLECMSRFHDAPEKMQGVDFYMLKSFCRSTNESAESFHDALYNQVVTMNSLPAVQSKKYYSSINSLNRSPTKATMLSERISEDLHHSNSGELLEEKSRYRSGTSSRIFGIFSERSSSQGNARHKPGNDSSEVSLKKRPSE